MVRIRSPHRPAIRAHRCFSHSGFRHNAPHAPVAVAPRVRAPGLDPSLLSSATSRLSTLHVYTSLSLALDRVPRPPHDINLRHPHFPNQTSKPRTAPGQQTYHRLRESETYRPSSRYRLRPDVFAVIDAIRTRPSLLARLS